MTPHDSDSPGGAAAVAHALRERRTVKLLADAPLDVADDRATIAAVVESAGWAPFHRPATPGADDGGMDAIVPWRFRLLDIAACRALRDWLLARGDAGPISRLLAACSGLAVVTWLPDPQKAGEPEIAPPTLFAGTLENMEHVAAAAAAVQSMLVAATARGLQTFWASGGPLRGRDALALLGVPPREVLLGAIFLSAGAPEGAAVKPGGLRDRRGEASGWSCWVDAASIADPRP